MFVIVWSRAHPLLSEPSATPGGSEMLDPKWYVIGAALVAITLLLSYDLTFGLIALGVMVTLLVIRVAFAIWLAPERGEPESERGALVDRFRRLSNNRRLARLRELGSKRGSNTSQRP